MSPPVSVRGCAYHRRIDAATLILAISTLVVSLAGIIATVYVARRGAQDVWRQKLYDGRSAAYLEILTLHGRVWDEMQDRTNRLLRNPGAPLDPFPHPPEERQVNSAVTVYGTDDLRAAITPLLGLWGRWSNAARRVEVACQHYGSDSDEVQKAMDAMVSAQGDFGEAVAGLHRAARRDLTVPAG